MMPLSLGKLPQGLKDLWMSLNDPLGSLNANLLGQDIRIDFIGKKVKVVEKIPIANQLDIGLLIDPLTIIFQKFNKRIIIKEIFEIIDRSILKDRTTPDMKVTHNNFHLSVTGLSRSSFKYPQSNDIILNEGHEDEKTRRIQKIGEYLFNPLQDRK